MSWDPSQYLKFESARMRPGLDLLGRIRATAPAIVYDLGCGTGALTAALSARWPAAEVIGIDTAEEMLARARSDYPNLDWRRADIRAWRADRPASVIFSNAALQWLDDHEALFARLIGELAPGGTLAVQMPCNFDAPSHRLIEEIAEAGPWSAVLSPLLRRRPVASPARYYDLLAAYADVVDIWQTTYLHVLTGEDPVLDWVRATALRPLTAALSPADARKMEAALGERLRQAYPSRADGRTVFPFQRIFIIAQAPG